MGVCARGAAVSSADRTRDLPGCFFFLCAVIPASAGFLCGFGCSGSDFASPPGHQSESSNGNGGALCEDDCSPSAGGSPTASQSSNASSAISSAMSSGSGGEGGNPATTTTTTSTTNTTTSATTSSTGSAPCIPSPFPDCNDCDPCTLDTVFCGQCLNLSECECASDADCDDGNPFSTSWCQYVESLGYKTCSIMGVCQ